MAAPRSPITQALVNAYPPRSDIRNDEQSLGGQVLNIIGNDIQDLYQQVQSVGKNYFLHTANTKDIDLVYKFQLPQTFTFENTSTNELIPDLQPPEVLGLFDGDWFAIELAEDNDIEAFWYNHIPSRITFETFTADQDFLDEDTNVLPGCILSGMTVADRAFFYGSYGRTLEVPNSIWVEITGGTKYLNIDDQGIPTRGTVIIAGLTSSGETDSETLIFLHDDIQRTIKEWKRIDKIEAYNIYPDTTKIRAFNNRFTRNSVPQLPPKLDWYNLAVDNETKQSIDTFWDVGNPPPYGMPLLQMKQYINSDIRDRVTGFIDKQVIREWSLLINDIFSSIDSVVDIAVEPFSNRIWIVDESNNLWLYDNELSLPNMSVMNIKDYDAMAVISPDTYHPLYSNSVQVELDYIWRRPIIDIVKHRVYVDIPFGSRQSIIDGEMVSYTDNSWITTTLDNRHLRPKDTFSLEQFGDWIFTLETVYTNGVTEIDQRIVSIDTKLAKAGYSLSDLTDQQVVGIDFDASQNMWICTLDGDSVYRKHRITFHTDTMLVDFDNKVLIFKEPYEQIKVTV